MEFVERVARRMHFSGFVALELHTFLAELSHGMMGTFGAVFVYMLGDSVIGGLKLLVFFFGMQRLVVGMMVPLLGRLMPRFGNRKVMTWSLLAGLLKLGGLIVVNETGSLAWLVPAAILGGFYIAGYNLVFHMLFLADNDDDKIGEQIGLIALIQYAGLVIGPVLAGFVVFYLGFLWLFGLAIIIMLISLVPLMRMEKHDHDGEECDVTGVTRFIVKEKRFSASVFLWYIAVAVNQFFWPIFIVTLGYSYTFLGSLKGGIMLVAGLSAFWLGRLYDRKPLKKVFVWASVGEAITWVWRLTNFSYGSLLAANVVGRLLSPVWWMKIRRNELKVGERSSRLMFSMAHGLIVSAGMLVSLVFGVWLLYLTEMNWPLLGGFVGGAVLLAAYLVRDK